MRGLAFSPETFNQLACRRQIFDDLNAEPSEQYALRHRSLQSLNRRPVPIPKNLASIWFGRDHVALTGPLAYGRTSRGVPHDEGTVSECAMRGTGPAILKTIGQHRISVNTVSFG